MSETSETARSAQAKWDIENNAGRGESIGEEHDTPEEAAEREGLKIVDVADPYSDHPGSCLVRATSGALVLICHVNGPWACTIAEPSDQGQTLAQALAIISTGQSAALTRAAGRLHGLVAFGTFSACDSGLLGQAYQDIDEDLPADRQYTTEDFADATTRREPHPNAADTYIAHSRV